MGISDIEESKKFNYTKKVKDTLKILGMTTKELQQYKYIGGDDGPHLEYFNNFFRDKYDFADTINHSSNCEICGHDIVKNFYILKEDDSEMSLMIIGSECKDRFLEKSKRTCEECDQPHKRRKYNICLDCQVKSNKCVECKGYKKCSFKTCYDCHSKNSFFRRY